MKKVKPYRPNKTTRAAMAEHTHGGLKTYVCYDKMMHAIGGKKS